MHPQVKSTRTGDEPLTTLGAHSFFGEMALLNPTGIATASVIVSTYLEGYLLGKADFAWLEAHHPLFRDYLTSAAKLRLQRMEKNHAKSLTHGSADLAGLAAVLDPTKRNLQRTKTAENKRKTAERAAAAAGGGLRGSSRASASRKGSEAEAAAAAVQEPIAAEARRLSLLPKDAISDPVFGPAVVAPPAGAPAGPLVV